MPPPGRRLTEADLPRAAALSSLVGWNQTAADWATFAGHGEVRVLDDDDPTLAASAAVLRYDAGLGWIAMVLVRPDRRGAGIATALMCWATAVLDGVGCVALDATPAGQGVYARLGFRAQWGLRRLALPASLPIEPDAAVRPLVDADWPAVLALDAMAFGAPREFLLRDFARRMPAAALVAVDGRGFALARDGRRAPQIGPVVAVDPAAARALIATALAAMPTGEPRALLDLRDAAMPAVGDWLFAHGAREERRFTRMVLGGDLPGDPATLVAVAGPEFG